MKLWMSAFSVASALFLSFACADDDKPISDATGGVGGEAGAGDTGGTHVGTGGTHTGGVAGGGQGAESGGGAGGATITCEPPVPPISSSGDGGAGGTGNGAGGESGGGGDSAGAGASAGGAGGESARGLAIQGDYVDNFMGHHVVTSSSWDSGSAVFHIAAYSNAAQWIVARNDQENEYNPCLWSRFDWTENGGVLYYCQSAYAAVSEEAARATPRPDASDPATKGCGGPFSWTALTAE